MFRSRRPDRQNNFGVADGEPIPATASPSAPNIAIASGSRNISASKSPQGNRNGILHGSLENLHRPVNYRSTSHSRRKGSRRNKHRPDAGGCSTGSIAGEFHADKPNNIVTAIGPTLMDENQMLYHALDEERKKILVRRAACSFLYGALRRQTERIARLETGVKTKTQEAAARFILHNLLLNSFRKREKEMDTLMKENNELHKSVENLNLQIRVVRHLQVTEKQRGVEKEHEINTIKNKLVQLKDLLDASQAQLATVEEESRNAHAERQKFEEETNRIQAEMKTTQDQFDFLTGNLELEKSRSAKLSAETFNQKRVIADLKKQVEELSSQSSQWQERARSFESANWELTLRLQERDRELAAVQAACKALNQQLFDGKEQRLVLKKQNEDLQSQLRTSMKDSTKLKKNISLMKTQIDGKVQENSDLEDAVKKIKMEYEFIRKELYKYKLENSRKRRVWANFFVTLVSPFETFRCLFIGSSQPRRIAHKNYKEVSLDPRQF